MDNTKLFLWFHMHQPDYYDPIVGVQVLPWVRRGILKGYRMVVDLVAKSEFKLNVNFTGSLVEQIKRYESDDFEDLYEKYEMANPRELTDADVAFIVRNFLSIGNFHSSRYCHLKEKKSRGEKFSEQDLRDVQFLFKLSAHAPLDREVIEFLKKGEGFTEEDKISLSKIEKETIRTVIPKYRELASNGKIEITFSPFHHPILPLLVDLRSAKISKANESIPAAKGTLVNDAVEQIKRGKSLIESTFGVSATGMWPSEGSVSVESIILAKELGVKWFGSDELVLRKNSQKGQGAYLFNGMKGIFRSHEMSDRVGFVYNKMPVEAAISDLKESIRHLRSLYIIIDGENPWESYQDSGVGFLSRLFEEFASYSVCGSDLEPEGEIAEILPGSWINGYFDTWIGNVECNTAWSYLYEAANKLGNCYESREEILKAESSDYFWWYSDFHKNEVNGVFDELFRHRLMQAYLAKKEKLPWYLYLPIK